MKQLLFILLLFITPAVASDYPLKDGKPTREGIKQYVEENADSLVKEYQDFIADTIYNTWIYAEDLTDYGIHDSLELGRYYPHEIYITTAESFIAYELADLSRSERNRLLETNKFVKAAVFHELTHEYINQISIEMQSIDRIRVDRAYQVNIWIIMSYETFGSSFIEEGICEYVVEKMGEIIAPRRPYIPKSVEELIDRENRYKMIYKYSSYFLRDFLDTTGLKRGIKILLHNPPPTYEEILHPESYFNRLKIPI